MMKASTVQWLLLSWGGWGLLEFWVLAFQSLGLRGLGFQRLGFKFSDFGVFRVYRVQGSLQALPGD